MQRWALTLGAYTYTIEYRCSADNANADGLSRLPTGLRQSVDGNPDVVDAFYVSQFSSLRVNSVHVRNETRKDPVLSQVYNAIMNGWSSQYEESTLKPYYKCRNEFAIHQGCIMWGIRVVIPKKLQAYVLDELHSNHTGIVRMKSVARSYVWWNNIDNDIESLVKMCELCQQVKHMPPSAPVHPWSWPSGPWQRVHVDFAGPFQDHMFLLAIDAHSTYPEIVIMRKTTASETVSVLRTVFARHGLPLKNVSDNGPQFMSEEFRHFLSVNGVRHVFSVPYHPSTNGQAERLVQSFKQCMKSSKCQGDIQKRLDEFLLKYRTTPHSLTKERPAKLLYNRELRTRLDLLKPSLNESMKVKQSEHLLDSDQNAREFKVDQAVWIRNYASGEKWLPGVIVSKDGSRYYTAQYGDSLCRRHIDQLREREVVSPVVVLPEVSSEKNSVSVLDISEETVTPNFESCDSKSVSVVDQSGESVIMVEDKLNEPMDLTPPTTLRRSSRVITPPDRLNLYIK